MREDGRGIQQLTGGIHHHHLDAGSQPRVQPQGDALAGRRRQQQILQVAGEHADGFIFGGFAQLAQQLGFQMPQQLHPPGPAHHLIQPAVSGTALIADAHGLGHQTLAGVQAARRGLGITQLQSNAQHALIAAP